MGWCPSVGWSIQTCLSDPFPVAGVRHTTDTRPVETGRVDDRTLQEALPIIQGLLRWSGAALKKKLIDIEIIPEYASFTGALGKKLFGNTLKTMGVARTRVREEIEDNPHERPYGGPDDEMVPGSNCLGFLAGQGLSWAQYRSSKFHKCL